jgi:hypothetical protein
VTYKLQLDISYAKNIILAKYSISLYVDGNKIAMIEHGKDYLQEVTLTPGEHEIRLEKWGDDSVSNTINVTVKRDSTLICEIKSHLNEIEIVNIRTVDSLNETDAIMPDVTELRLDKAIDKLEEAGFTNISTRSEGTIIIKSNWVVTEQNIQAGSKVNRTSEVILTCVKDA